jgi:2-haloacid dehalogenase
MPKPQAVIFDIGNVLVEWQPERFYDARIGAAARKHMFEAVDLHAMNDGIDRGGDFHDIIHETAARYPEFGDEIRLWHSNWVELASPAIDHSAHLNRALRSRGVQTFILSNIGHDTFDIARSRYPFLDEFDRYYISARMGVIKPEAEIYAMVEADCGLPAKSLLFADDRPENITAAADRGWQTHLFRDPESWAGALVAAGLLTKHEVQP